MGIFICQEDKDEVGTEILKGTQKLAGKVVWPDAKTDNRWINPSVLGFRL